MFTQLSTFLLSSLLAIPALTCQIGGDTTDMTGAPNRDTLCVPQGEGQWTFAMSTDGIDEGIPGDVRPSLPPPSPTPTNPSPARRRKPKRSAKHLLRDLRQRLQPQRPLRPRQQPRRQFVRSAVVDRGELPR